MAENRTEKINKNGVATNALLSITLYEGRELKPDDFLGKYDPYVTLILDEDRFSSSYKIDSVDPVWNEDFSLYIILLK